MSLLQLHVEMQTKTSQIKVQEIFRKGGHSPMKILLFKDKNLEPFKIYHNPNDVTICNDEKVMINEIGNKGHYNFVHLQTELIACKDSDQRELCLLLFVEEKSQ